MVKIKFPLLKQSSKKIKQTGVILGSTLLLSGFLSCGNVEYVDTEVFDPTQGVITKLQEVEQNKFKITDEEIVATKDDSRIIAAYLDGSRDTLTLAEVQLVEADNPRRSGMNGILMYGMMGYMMGRSMSTPVNSSAYANKSAYDKSTKTTSNLRSTATKKTVRTPKKGFGSGASKSSRSYGG